MHRFSLEIKTIHVKKHISDTCRKLIVLSAPTEDQHAGPAVNFRSFRALQERCGRAGQSDGVRGTAYFGKQETAASAIGAQTNREARD